MFKKINTWTKAHPKTMIVAGTALVLAATVVLYAELTRSESIPEIATDPQL